MEIMISRIGNHIYAKDAAGAIKFYREAFDLEEQGKPWLDDEGLIIHQDLVQKNGNLFLGITDYKHLPDELFKRKFTADICPSMLFYVFYLTETELYKSFTVLSEGATLCRELEADGKDTICEIIDKFGAFWHLRLVAQENQGSWNMTKMFNIQ